MTTVFQSGLYRVPLILSNRFVMDPDTEQRQSLRIPINPHFTSDCRTAISWLKPPFSCCSEFVYPIA